MKKKVLYSIIAMTSASSLTAYADATVDQIKTDNAEDWTGSDDLTVESGVITSPAGTAISQAIGKLLNGTYRLTTENADNAVIKVNGTVLDAANQFTLKTVGETDVTITIEAKTSGQKFEVSGMKLELVYTDEINNALKALNEKVSKITAEIISGNANAQEQLTKASEISAMIAEFNNEKKAYEAYRKYELYKGYENSTIMEELEKLEASVNDAKGAAALYEATKALYKKYKDSFDEINTDVEDITDADTKKYVEGFTADQKKAITEKLAVIDEITKKYDNGNGDISNECSDAANKAFEDAIKPMLDKYQADVTDAGQDWPKHVEIAKKIADLRQAAVTASQEIATAAVPVGDGHAGLFDTLLTESRNRFNEVNAAISAVEKQNGTDDNCSQAFENYDKNTDALTEAESSINSIKMEYIDKANDANAKYTEEIENVNTEQERITKLQKNPDVYGEKGEYTKDIDAVQQMLDGLKGDIEKAYKEYKADGDYTARYTEIQSQLTDIETNAKLLTDNYDAYQAVNESLKDVQFNFDEAKKKVNALTSEEKDNPYKAEGHYAGTEVGFQKSIDDFQEDARIAYNDGTCSVWKTENAEKIEALGTRIGNYVTVAEQVLDNYKETVKAVAGYEAKVKELEGKVGDNGNVTVTSEPGKTYRDKIGEYKKVIKDINDAVGAALKVNDQQHIDGLKAAKTLADDNNSMTAEIEALIASFDNDKAQYDNNVIENALQKILAQATENINAATTALGAEPDKEKTGNAYDDFLKAEYDNLKSEIDKLTQQVEDAKTNTDKNEAMATLKLVNDGLVAINESIVDYNNKKADAEKSVSDNIDKKKEAEKSLKTIQDEIGKIENNNKDDSRRDEFTNLKTVLQDKYDTLNKKIEQACKDETLVDRWKDSEQDGETVKGFGTKIKELLDDVNEANDAAKASTDNLNAYNAVKKAAEDASIDKTVESLPSKLDAIPVGDDARECYNTRIEEAKVSYYKTLTDAEASYEARVSVNGDEAKKLYGKDALILLIDNLKKEVNSIEGDAKANEKQHEAQVNLYNSVDKLWNNAYTTIATEDFSSEAQNRLNRLNELKKDLDTAKTDLGDAYKKGESDKQDVDITAELNRINAEIKKIQDYVGSPEYDKVIADDNEARHEDFLTAHAEAIKAFGAAVETIGKYNALTNKVLAEEVAIAVPAADTEVNRLLNLLYTLRTDELNAYNSTVSPDLFDISETYKKQAVEHMEAINAALKALDDDVSGLARTEYAQAFTGAEEALAAAIADLESQKYSKQVVDEAFADVRGIVKDAQNGINPKTKDFALIVDGLLNRINTVTALLDAGKDAAAISEYGHLLDEAKKKAETELGELENFSYTDNADHDRYINDYKALVERYITKNDDPAVETVEDLRENTADGDMYEEFAEMQALFNQFNTAATNLYLNAKAAKESQEANIEAYGEMTEALDGLQALLDEAADYVGNLVITNLDENIDNYQEVIDGMRTDIESWLKKGWCVEYKDNFNNDIEMYTARIKSLYTLANSNEENKIRTEIEALKGDQNKAASAVSGKEALEAEVEEYTTKIKDFKDAFEDKVASADFIASDNDAKQEYYIGIEKQIADLRAELAGYYNADLGETTYRGIADRIEAIKTAYAEEAEKLKGCHEDVQKLFSDKLDAVNTKADALKADADKYNADGDILFYDDKLSFNIDKLDKELESLADAIDKAQAPYTANQEAYDRLTAELQELQASLDAMAEKVGAYKYISSIYIEDNVPDIQGLIDSGKEAVDNAYAETGLDESSKLPNKDLAEAWIAHVDKEATYAELSAMIGNANDEEDGLSELYNKVQNTIRTSKYTADERTELTNRLYATYELINALYAYNHNAYTHGYVTEDIDGKPVTDGQDQPAAKAVDYIKEAEPAIRARISEIAEQLGTLATDAEEKAYILGDTDRDGYIRTNDYMEILALALGNKEAEEGTVKFLAADVNEDLKINIADLTMVTNKMLGKELAAIMSEMKAAPAASNEPDAIELTADDTENVKVIAINLKSSRSYVAMQLDVNLPAGVTLLSEKLGGRADDHVLYSNTLADGTHRIIVSSMQNSAFTAADDAVIYLEVSGSKAGRLTVSEVMATDAKGALYTIDGNGDNGTTGIDGVNAETTLKEKIYSVGGQMMKTIKKGINIIRNSDGSAKKVMKK